jgi:hypothetical protein
LNYNSPGATGALPIAAMLAQELIEQGILYRSNHDSNYKYTDVKTPNWDTAALFEEITQ